MKEILLSLILLINIINMVCILFDVFEESPLYRLRTTKIIPLSIKIIVYPFVLVLNIYPLLMTIFSQILIIFVAAISFIVLCLIDSKKVKNETFNNWMKEAILSKEIFL